MFKVADWDDSVPVSVMNFQKRVKRKLDKTLDVDLDEADEFLIKAKRKMINDEWQNVDKEELLFSEKEYSGKFNKKASQNFTETNKKELCVQESKSQSNSQSSEYDVTVKMKKFNLFPKNNTNLQKNEPHKEGHFSQSSTKSLQKIHSNEMAGKKRQSDSKENFQKIGNCEQIKKKTKINHVSTKTNEKLNGILKVEPKNSQSTESHSSEDLNNKPVRKKVKIGKVSKKLASTESQKVMLSNKKINDTVNGDSSDLQSTKLYKTISNEQINKTTKINLTGKKTASQLNGKLNLSNKKFNGTFNDDHQDSQSTERQPNNFKELGTKVPYVQKKKVPLRIVKLKSILQSGKEPVAKEDQLIRTSFKVDGEALRQRMMNKLKVAQFRYLNEQLYTASGLEAHQMFKSDPQAFKMYHQGYQQQLKKWPINPLDVIVKKISAMPKNYVIADMGCGEANLSKQVSHRVLSFDLVASEPDVIECDMGQTPLKNSSVDVVVYCLALMGTELTKYLVEANRVLKIGGQVIIAEVESRFQDVKDFCHQVQRLGFKLKSLNKQYDVFFFLQFEKAQDSPVKKSLPMLTLKPCVYKKR